MHADRQASPVSAAHGGFDAATLGAPPPQDFTQTRQDLERFRGGDIEAFGLLWQRYAPALELIVAARLLPRLAPELRARIELDDVLQIASRKVQAKLCDFEFRGPGSILAWMTAIVTHVVTDQIDYWRAAARDVRRERALPGRDADTGSSAVPAPDPGHGPATRASRAEQRRCVARALQGLSERHQTIVILRFFAGATWEEIAAELAEGHGGDAVRMEFNGKLLPLLAKLLARSE
jgi:RNA polymerase sigma factor (sigma-70 family)